MQVLNAIKYSTAFPVIIFSAMKYQVTVGAWQGLYKPLWLGAALLNSSYSYFWDIERDWEIQLFTSSGVFKPLAMAWMQLAISKLVILVPPVPGHLWWTSVIIIHRASPVSCTSCPGHARWM